MAMPVRTTSLPKVNKCSGATFRSGNISHLGEICRENHLFDQHNTVMLGHNISPTGDSTSSAKESVRLWSRSHPSLRVFAPVGPSLQSIPGGDCPLAKFLLTDPLKRSKSPRWKVSMPSGRGLIHGTTHQFFLCLSLVVLPSPIDDLRIQ